LRKSGEATLRERLAASRSVPLERAENPLANKTPE